MNKNFFYLFSLSRSMSLFFLILLLLACLWTLGSYLVVRNTPQPKYVIREKRIGYEIRDYASMIVAEVEVTGPRKETMNEGFRLLADYIFGNNTEQKSIAMTAPVMDTVSKKIAMTAPVMETLADTGVRKVTFTMPSTFTLETLPVPNNPQVHLVQIPARKMAVIRFSWWAGGERFDRIAQTLFDLLKRDGIQTVGKPIFAGYNPPFSSPWMHRNEVMIEVLIDT